MNLFKELLKIKDVDNFYSLHGDLIEHIWEQRGRIHAKNEY